MNNEILDKWNEIKAIIESLDLDAAKNSKGVAAAGIRLRKGLRDLKSEAAGLVKLSLESDKSNKENK